MKLKETSCLCHSLATEKGAWYLPKAKSVHPNHTIVTGPAALHAVRRYADFDERLFLH
jgi:hypothetical protein